MAKPQPETKRSPARLYLVTPRIEDAAAFAQPLAAATAAADIAAVLLRLAKADERTLVNRIKALAPVVQGQNAALLIDGDPAVAVRGGADGAHLTGIENFLAAVDGVKPARIAGCGGLATRDDAMTAAERGADYVMFGEPLDGRRPSFEAIVERVAWWAEVFEVPCVAFAATMEEVGPLVAAGADFVALSAEVWHGASGIAAIAAAAHTLATLEVVP